MMKAKGLQVVATEVTRTGQAFGAAFIGRVDLVLGGPSSGADARRIVDLKWGGAGRKQKLLEAGAAVLLLWATLPLFASNWIFRRKDL